jgi:hypothetical protein
LSEIGNFAIAARRSIHLTKPARPVTVAKYCKNLRNGNAIRQSLFNFSGRQDKIVHRDISDKLVYNCCNDASSHSVLALSSYRANLLSQIVRFNLLFHLRRPRGDSSSVPA